MNTVIGPDQKQLTEAVERARRRLLAHLVVRESAWAATIALLGPTLLLLLGRRWVGWPVLALFAAAGAGLALWQWSRRRPSLYQVSQVLDARLASQDQISTAIYFLEAEHPAAREQRRAAAAQAGRSGIEEAFPFTLPRSVYGLALVFLIASGLWAIRHWLEKPMRLEHPLPRVILQAIRGEDPAKPEPPVEIAEAGRELSQTKALGLEAEDAERRGEPQAGRQGATPAPEGASDAGDDSRKDGQGEGPGDGPGDEFGDPMSSGDQPIQSYEDMLDRDAKSGLAKGEGKQDKGGESSSDKKDGSGGSPESNSLLAKLRDAMNNMLSRLQQKSPGGSQQQAASGSSNSGEKQDGQGEGRAGAGQPQPGGEESGEGEGSDGDSKDGTPQKAAGKNGGKSSDGGSRGSSGDGAGQQEGDKAIADAQQQEVLGKLSELYGRRAANVTGEVTVEAQPGKQTLRTPQSAKQGSHQDSGGQISRDEIPLAYQAYVKEYFNRLRQGGKKQ